jgi:hypothetical protein
MMKSRDQKQYQRSGKDHLDGQGEGRPDPFEATGTQPKDTPARKAPASPDEQEERSNLADIGEADEQEGPVDGVKQGSAHQDPPATRPQHQRRERRHNL